MADTSSSSASGAALLSVSKEVADKVNCLLDLLEGFGKEVACSLLSDLPQDLVGSPETTEI